MRLTTLLGLIVTCALGCLGGSDVAGPPSGSGAEPVTADVGGRVQKGPFINGTSIDITELDTGLVQTGKVFTTTIVDDTGTFGIDDITLASSVVRIAADGYYFDEVRGDLSDGRLVLLSYADVTNATSTNVNLLGHLEAARIEHLVGEAATPFTEAKAQAHEEVLAIFGFDAEGVGDAEQLDIAQDGEGNAKLLAMSVILQGTRTVAELAELLSSIQTDIRSDGVMDSMSSGNALMNGARTVTLARVRANLEQRFDDLGLSATVADFESHVAHFIESAPYEFTAGIEYAADGIRPNLLDKDVTTYQSDESGLGLGLGFRAVLPATTQLRIRITKTGAGAWSYGPSLDWRVTLRDGSGSAQEFTAAHDGVVDLEQFFLHVQAADEPDPPSAFGSARIDYFEYGSEEPTFSKDVTWAP